MLSKNRQDLRLANERKQQMLHNNHLTNHNVCFNQKGDKMLQNTYLLSVS